MSSRVIHSRHPAVEVQIAVIEAETRFNNDFEMYSVLSFFSRYYEICTGSLNMHVVVLRSRQSQIEKRLAPVCSQAVRHSLAAATVAEGSVLKAAG